VAEGINAQVGRTLQALDSAYEILSDHLKRLTLAEALFVPTGGYRSIIGTLKHTAGWSHVYRSYAFDASPTSWGKLAWPQGMRDTIRKSDAYLTDLIRWLELSHRLWQKNLINVQEQGLDQPRPTHWGDIMPLYVIVQCIANHNIYHAGEINQILSICRHEAWEEGEEVEENNIASEGHRVVPPWKR
jgi:uncharacterized damage-inducible protein DinB